MLNKLNIVLSGTINEETKSQDFIICTDNVHLKVSTSIIRLLSAVATQFSSHHVDVNKLFIIRYFIGSL